MKLPDEEKRKIFEDPQLQLSLLCSQLKHGGSVDQNIFVLGLIAARLGFEVEGDNTDPTNHWLRIAERLEAESDD